MDFGEVREQLDVELKRILNNRSDFFEINRRFLIPKAVISEMIPGVSFKIRVIHICRF